MPRAEASATQDAVSRALTLAAKACANPAVAELLRNLATHGKAHTTQVVIALPKPEQK